MSRNARVSLLLLVLVLVLGAIALDVTGIAERDWWQLALPAVAAVILVFVLIREVRVR